MKNIPTTDHDGSMIVNDNMSSSSYGSLAQSWKCDASMDRAKDWGRCASCIIGDHIYRCHNSLDSPDVVRYHIDTGTAEYELAPMNESHIWPVYTVFNDHFYVACTYSFQPDGRMALDPDK
jgi:hypothetical protein